MNTSIISFPGLGIDPFTVNRVAFEIGPLKVYWYGVIICLGIILGFTLAYLRMKKIGVTGDDVADLALISVPCAIVGARLYYVLATLENVHSFYDVIAVWEGGLAIYGGVIGGVIGFTLVCKYKKKPILKMYDCAAPGLILGQILGRWGNFFNAEAFGDAVQYEFLGRFFDISSFSETNPLRMTIDGIIRHPTFLYESLWNLVGFALMNIFFSKKAFDGEVLLWYLSWYGLGRSLIEGFRTDSLYIGTLRVSQILAFICFVVGVIAIISIRIKKHIERKNEYGYNN